MKYLMIVDTETGGLSPENSSIIELAAQLYSVDVTHDVSWSTGDNGVSPSGLNNHGKMFKVVPASGIFHRLLIPRLPVQEQAAAINGYDPDRWERDGMLPHVVMRSFLRFITTSLPEELPEGSGGVIWTGSNVLGFDLPFLRSEMAASGLELPGKPLFARRTLNTESLCFPLFARGYTDSCGVAALRKWAGLKGEQHHTAIGDIEDTATIVSRYLNFINSAFQLSEGSFCPPEATLSTLETPRILDVARAAGIELKEVQPGEYLGHVPWRDDNNPSLHIYSEQDKWVDFGTSQNGNVADFIARLGEKQ